MPFCTACGSKLEDGDVFCGMCGTVVPAASVVEHDSGSKLAPEESEAEESHSPKDNFELEDKLEAKKKLEQEQESESESESAPESDAESCEEKLKRCPACGEILGINETVCPACSFEIRDVTDGSISELYQKLEAIENLRPEKSKRDSDGDSATDEKLASAIRNYPIPNTKEDLIEFVVMANANARWDDERASDRAVLAAWQSKFEQAYSKAEILFGETDDFKRFRDMKVKAQRRVCWAKIEAWVPLLVMFIFAVLLWVLGFFLNR